MSVHNEEKYVKDAVDSILNQTFTEFEFIIIDDGSTDKTAEILKGYTDNRLRLIVQENLGLTRALNKGLKVARGVYVARMDGDDIAHPERLDREAKYLDAHTNVGIVGTFIRQVDENGRYLKQCRYETESEKIKKKLWVDCPFCHPTVMFRKSCIEKVGCYREKIGPAEDYDLWFRISEICDVANIAEPLHKYRIDPHGVSISRRFDQIRSTLLVRRLAKERREYGKDSLEVLSDEELKVALEKLLLRNRRNERRVASSNYAYLAEVSYCTGNYKDSLRWLIESFRAQAFNRRGLILSPKLALCMLLSEENIERVKRLIRN